MPPDLRNLTAYLQEPRHLPGGIHPGTVKALGVILGVLAFAAFVYFLRIAHISYIFFLFFGGGIYSGVRKWIQDRARDRMRHKSGLTDAHWKALDMFEELASENRLAKRIHPSVGSALDRCAAAAMDVRRMLDEPGRLPELREQALRGVDEEMVDALLDALPWVRAKGAQRRSFEERIEADPDPVEAVRLRERAGQMETLRDDLVAALGQPNRGVHRVLADLRELRQAEEELRQGI